MSGLTISFFAMPIAIALVAVGFFFLVLKFVSLLAWTPWTKQIPVPQDLDLQQIPTCFFFIQGVFSRWIGYNNCLRVKLSEQGIFIRPFPPFSIFHPWLFLPWQALHSTKKKTVCIVLEFLSPANSRFRLFLPHSFASKLPLILKLTENA